MAADDRPLPSPCTNVDKKTARNARQGHEIDACREIAALDDHVHVGIASTLQRAHPAIADA
ncbi:hypothetical protein [Crenobacter caeni]|uniref:Uncharacterized protein n=1 Tax=Crenobacter caeni TaxID=2705474 RepID=A0A6B2KQG6_9NEIS|nr:hypothetical protein [Crenobacter caeni]NDV12482.1 hypothetical protein [Crenobacter caeni]